MIAVGALACGPFVDKQAFVPPSRVTRRCGLGVVQLVLLSVALSGCGRRADVPGGPLDQSANALHATFSGDINQKVAYKGEEVGIGYIPTERGAFFSISGARTVDGKELNVTLGPLVGIELKPGPAAPGDGFLHGGMVSYGSPEKPGEYSSANFIRFYDTTPDTSGSASTLIFTKADKEPSDNSMLVRYHLVGRFSIHTAHSPDPLSRACIMDAISVALDRRPPYNAQICQAKRADVDATFDVRVDLPKAAG